MMILNCIHLFILLINPFLVPLKKADRIALDSLKPISIEDQHRYLIYDQTHQVDPAGMYYLDYPVTFLAVKKESADFFQSVVFYVEADSTFSEAIVRQFGPPVSTMDFGADIEDANGQRRLQYTTHAWRCDTHMMIVAPIEKKKVLVGFRVWIKQLD